MRQQRFVKNHILRPFSIGLLSLIVLLLVFPAIAMAHPLDQYWQATTISLAPGRATLKVEITPGVLVAPAVLALTDTNRDGEVSDAEGEAYGAIYLKDIVLEVDGHPRTIALTHAQFPAVSDLSAGLGTIVLDAAAEIPADNGHHRLFYKNNYQPASSIYQTDAFVLTPGEMESGQPERDALQRSLSMDYTVTVGALAQPSGDGAGVAGVATTAPGVSGASGGPDTAGAALTAKNENTTVQVQPPGGVSGQLQQLVGYLREPNISPWVLILAVGLSILLGGLHALTPGHGKTLAAAYLIGSRATTRHAIALGGIVTITHTSSVIAIGLLALLASQFIVPNVLVPALEVLSGLLVVMMGVRLIRERWRGLRSPDHHDHGHTHDHSHDHPHPPENVKRSELLAMGISGGLVPCPEALGIMLIAIGVNRMLLGLGLIVAFSFGLAAVLIIIGVLLVRSKALANRLGGLGGLAGPWQRLLPLASAVIVTLLGLGIAFNGLVAYAR